MNKIIVIGAGASGLMAAISAARAGNAHVTLLEQDKKIGKKLLVTGNGRCNLTNLNMDASFFHSHHSEVVRRVLDTFNEKDTCNFFEEIGLFLRERDGYVYPWCQRATQVAEVLENEVKKNSVEVMTETLCTDIEKNGKEWIVKTNHGPLCAPKIILATGAIAGNAPKESRDMIDVCKRFHHQTFPFFPALVQLRVKDNPLKPANGVRTEVMISLFCGDKCLKEDRGELQITDYGISGIPVFQISRFVDAAKAEGEKIKVIIDFLPQVSADDFKVHFLNWTEKNRVFPVTNYFSGIFHPKLTQIFLKRGSCPAHLPASDVTSAHLEKFVRVIKGFACEIEGSTGFLHAQVCSGGVSLNDISVPSMESAVTKGLYLCGELLDSDGECGGYNLQWAWSTGYLAGVHAATEGV